MAFNTLSTDLIDETLKTQTLEEFSKEVFSVCKTAGKNIFTLFNGFKFYDDRIVFHFSQNWAGRLSFHFDNQSIKDVMWPIHNNLINTCGLTNIEFVIDKKGIKIYTVTNGLPTLLMILERNMVIHQILGEMDRQVKGI